MSADLFRLDGKTAVITGGSRGLGLDMARGFLIAGAKRVYISSRKAGACDEAVATLNKLAKTEGYSGDAVALPADLSKPDGAKMLAKAYAANGEDSLDILVANAGASWGEEFATHSAKALDRVLDLNVKGVFLSIQAFEPFLEEAGTPEDPSRVLVTGSIAGIRSGMSGGTYGYLASKAAVHHLAKTLAVELGPRAITVNVLAPGFFPTKMSNGLLESLGDDMTATNPLGRLGEPRDIIGAAVYLASPAASYVNGTVLTLDGGAHLAGRI